MQLTRQQAEALAAFVHLLRPDWDVVGLVAALGRARDRGSAEDVAHAAIAAAGTPQARTPGVIPMDGPHWHTHRRGDGYYRPPRADEECRRHPGNFRDTCRGCAGDRLAGDRTPPQQPQRAKQFPNLPRDPQPARDEALEEMRRVLDALVLCGHGVDRSRVRCRDCDEGDIETYPTGVRMPQFIDGREVRNVNLP